ncbi:hypothetical protein E8E13_002764 [Curvularia kusanoi]|uniref:Uncharacterized protein n=1 Tax=Curvularia kusanoi TaxID=90978 RepID=A0A9P4W3Z3_CURKU|nr:hypothetical protein E8E13_002764 [Curvularia kusanoi]
MNQYNHPLESVHDAAAHWEQFDQFRQSHAQFDLFGVRLKNLFPAIDERNTARFFDIRLARISDDDDYSDDDYRHRDFQVNIKLAAVGLQGRRMITTQTGFLGLAPDETDIGDLIVVVLGCAFPIVLRPHDSSFKYIGECYVDGLMNGEALESVNREEFPLEDVQIV